MSDARKVLESAFSKYRKEDAPVFHTNKFPVEKMSEGGEVHQESLRAIAQDMVHAMQQKNVQDLVTALCAFLEEYENHDEDEHTSHSGEIKDISDELK